MKILVSDTLNKDLKKIFKSDKSKNTFLIKLKRINPELIYLKRPYVKIKVSLLNTAFRIIGKYEKINGILVLVFILKKIDKNFGENIVWNKKLENQLNIRLSHISDDIENNNYELF